jgi:DNA-binding transcriptional LysR family regulator
MNKLEALRVFAAASSTRNFREAAQRLAVSPQAITRGIRELEEQLGEPLFHRNTRGVQLTGFGEQLAGRAREAVAGIDGLFQHATRRAPSEHAGLVRITAPPFIGRGMLMDALAPCLMQFPGLRIDLRLSEAFADAVDQQIDIGIRIGMLRDSSLVVRPVAQVNFSVVATPGLLQRIGRPTRLDQLTTLPTTALIDRNTGRVWPWMFSRGRQVNPPAPAFVTDDPEAECAAVLAGAGIGQLSGLLAAPHLRSGALVHLLTRETSEPWTLFVYRAQRGPVPARVRVVFDALVEVLGTIDLGTQHQSAARGTRPMKSSAK